MGRMGSMGIMVAGGTPSGTGRTLSGTGETAVPLLGKVSIFETVGERKKKGSTFTDFAESWGRGAGGWL
jgi:hypothetical protein